MHVDGLGHSCVFVVLATNDNSNMIEYSLVSDGVRVMNVLELHVYITAFTLCAACRIC